MGEPYQDDLITKAQDGGPDAAGTLYEQHQRSIFRYLTNGASERKGSQAKLGNG